MKILSKPSIKYKTISFIDTNCLLTPSLLMFSLSSLNGGCFCHDVLSRYCYHQYSHFQFPCGFSLFDYVVFIPFIFLLLLTE